MYGTLALVALIALVVLVWAGRAIFNGRVRASSGRNRQPRLGVVDAYDIDRQRQLVIVRRDGVEHLVMIGGPNDVLIESGIVRVAVPSRERAERETISNGQTAPEAKIFVQPQFEPLPPAPNLEDQPPFQGAAVAVSPPLSGTPPPLNPVAPAPPKSMMARVAARITSAAAVDPQITEGPTAPFKNEDTANSGATPKFAQNTPLERLAPLKSGVVVPQIVPPQQSEAPSVQPVHTPEDLELLRQLQSWVPQQAPNAAEMIKSEPELVTLQTPSAVAQPVSTPSAIAAPVSIAPVRPSLSTAPPRPTFTPRTFTPMKPVAPPLRLDPVASPAPPVTKVETTELSVAERSTSASQLDDLEEEMARLLGRPVKSE